MDSRILLFIFGLLTASYSSVSMNRKGDLYARSMLDGDIVFEPGMGTVLVDRGGYEYDILEQIDISNQVAAQVCWLVPQRPSPVWNNMSSIPTATFGSAAVTVGSSIFVIGGNDATNVLSSVQVLNVQTMTWSTKAPMNNARQYHVAAAHSDGSRIFVFGGQGRTDIEIYDVAANTWTVSPLTLPSSFDKVASAVVDNVVYFFGAQSNGTLVNSFSMYNQAWKTNLAQMPTSRYNAGAASFGKNIYVFGGVNANSSILSTFEMYNTATNTWESLNPIDVGRQQHQLINFNGLLALVGGVNDFDSAVSSVYWFNTRNRMWRTDFAQLSMNRYAFAAATAERQVFVFGGRTGASGATSLTEFTLPCF